MHALTSSAAKFRGEVSVMNAKNKSSGKDALQCSHWGQSDDHIADVVRRRHHKHYRGLDKGDLLCAYVRDCESVKAWIYQDANYGTNRIYNRRSYSEPNYYKQHPDTSTA